MTKKSGRLDFQQVLFSEYSKAVNGNAKVKVNPRTNFSVACIAEGIWVDTSSRSWVNPRECVDQMRTLDQTSLKSYRTLGLCVEPEFSWSMSVRCSLSGIGGRNPFIYDPNRPFFAGVSSCPVCLLL